ncbi:MAG TPA: AAA family ATPase [Candidatus Krumholzibacteriaceae bacterium]|nr:AAA family ATPase [Candidatus Krumholzibacteriaceae bacterium]
MKAKKVIGVAGMPGAGKSLVTRIAEEMDYFVVIMGDVVREETAKRGLNLTPENVGAVMLKLRDEEGHAAVAKHCIPKVENAKSDIVVIDGLRSLNEVEEYKRHFKNFVTIAVHASPETRFQRLFRRKRSDDPQGWESFRQRDMRELSVGLGNVIATADYMTINEGPKIQTEKQIHNLLRRITGR